MKKGIIIALILMSIGFAAVATTLTITGTINYGYDTKDFNVIFSEAILDGVVNNNLIDTDDKKSITFETRDLSKQGDRSILEYQVMNNSKQYDASVTIECKRLTAEGIESEQEIISEYTEITPSPKTLIVKAQESRRGTITVELKKVSTEEKEEKFKCSLTVTPTEREEVGSQYIAEDSCKSVAKPNLGTNGKLIPVTIDESGKVTKLNAENSDWYNYCDKKWANAVILKDEITAPNDGEQIEMDNIESMFVWIPKYKYRLWNVNVTDPLYTVHSIEIEFDTNDTTDIDGVSCTTPGVSGDTGNCDNGEYMTHPAFKSFGVSGFWVGKFETGYKDAQSMADAQQDNAEPSNIVIKPDVYSWRGLSVKNMFNASKNYNENLDSHMLKNTEWGAVAYLSHSIYGTNKEVTINNNDKFKTGYAALPSTDQSKMYGIAGDGDSFNTAWDEKNGFTASTTGNITGVYDMAGSAWEYVAAYLAETPKDSDFTIEELSTLETKYIDVYDKESTSTTYNNMILGDATGEMGPFDNYADSDNKNRWHNRWYADNSTIVDSKYPWFNRSGAYNYGVLTGLFYFAGETGDGSRGFGFRLALAPSN